MIDEKKMHEVFQKKMDEYKKGGITSRITRRIDPTEFRKEIVIEFIKKDPEIVYEKAEGTKLFFEGCQEWIDEYGLEKADEMAKKRVRKYANKVKKLTSLFDKIKQKR